MKLLCIDTTDSRHWIGTLEYSYNDQCYYVKWSGWTTPDKPIITSLTFMLSANRYASYEELNFRIADHTGWLLIQLDSFTPFVNPTKPILDVVKNLYPELFI